MSLQVLDCGASTREHCTIEQEPHGLSGRLHHGPGASAVWVERLAPDTVAA